jgi:hypothetical protein
MILFEITQDFKNCGIIIPIVIYIIYIIYKITKLFIYNPQALLSARGGIILKWSGDLPP